MELEFDKEIDAILRKARDGVAVASTPKAGHLDADTIAAFAENALPDKTRLLYMEHFADCDRCRKQLSHAILLNNEADAAAASTVSAPVAAPAIPWYQRIFRTPNMALAMGALVLAFSGILGYLALQKGTQNGDVAQVSDPQEKRGGPYYSGDAANTTANSVASNAAANTMAPAANSAAVDSNSAENAPAGAVGGPSPSADGTAGRADATEEKPASEDSKAAAVGGATVAPEKPVVAAPPPADKATTERERKEAEADEVTATGTVAGKDDDLAKKKTENGRRDNPAPASKVGPSRSGPLQNQTNQSNAGLADMSVTRVISGKRFQNKDGAWYDSAYHGQGTTNVRRGTDEFKKLDGGLRNIANTLGGTVVVVWKDKAYRIQ